MVAAASGSVGETIAPRTKAASQGRPGTSACAAQATAHEHESYRAERERADVGPEVAEVREDRLAVEDRRQEDDEHELGFEPHLGQPGDEPEQGTAQDEHDRVRYRQQAGQSAQAHDGH